MSKDQKLNQKDIQKAGQNTSSIRRAQKKEDKKFHTLDLKKNYKKVILGVLAAGVLSLLLLLGYYKFAVHRTTYFGKEAQFEIKSGEAVIQISNRLYEESLVNSAFLFRFYVLVNGLQNQIQAGSYKIPAGSSVVELVALFKHGISDLEITFLEGWRVEEFARHASEKFAKIDYSEFVSMAKGSEGYLFPDTYKFNLDVTEDQMIETLKQTFDSRIEDLLSQEILAKMAAVNLAANDLTFEQAIILASIVERESFASEERPIVAGILINRYRNGQQIDADATTQYAIAAGRYGCETSPKVVPKTICPDAEKIPNVDWWPADLTQQELDYKHPFNTRAVAGLPPYPISNPGLSAIEAVINAADTDYLFYLHDLDGFVHYAETIDEHNANVAQFLN